MVAGYLRVGKPDPVARVAAKRVNAVVQPEKRPFPIALFDNDLHEASPIFYPGRTVAERRCEWELVYPIFYNCK